MQKFYPENVLFEIYDFVTSSDVRSFSGLLTFAKSKKYDDWFRFIVDNCDLILPLVEPDLLDDDFSATDFNIWS